MLVRIILTMTLDTSDSVTTPFSVDLQEVEAAVGSELGPSPWLVMEQSRIDSFADTTEDHQWIHVDADRAAEGPFGRTIAHGYLTLAMVPKLLAQILQVTGRSSGVNYGMEKVRFITPVREGARIRMRGSILSATPRSGGMQYRLGLTVELEDSEKPAMVGEFLVLAFP